MSANQCNFSEPQKPGSAYTVYTAYTGGYGSFSEKLETTPDHERQQEISLDNSTFKYLYRKPDNRYKTIPPGISGINGR